ncbi:uncharacterized protein C11orf87 homolog [Entelurus aequoreus]|uniref:uncharacterized protein C11orf87 homolog n=1 Tax=Entelurus aequoreus TaxID=161455 RepID=UPI002B1DEE2B|nr:uncharacterized protein C11orf87 homolog [Entelurus aequoreus]
MTPSSSEAPGFLGLLWPPADNRTRAEQLGAFPPLSSTLALLVLVAVLAGIVLVSVATFHFHKRRLQKRKIQRAQEEYERDSGSPARAAGAAPARPCVIARPPRRTAEEEKMERGRGLAEEDAVTLRK